jgi:DNA-binding PadR family transcriptional regulator
LSELPDYIIPANPIQSPDRLIADAVQFSLDARDDFLYYVETVAKGESLGEFEHLVLLAVLRLRHDAYGMRVRREIAERTGRDVSIGAVYATLDRLAAKGFVSASVADPTPERGGRAKRSFQVTGTGLEALRRTREDLAAMLDGLTLPAPRGSR